MEYIGNCWKSKSFVPEKAMIPFCGCEHCLVDGNGRVRLCQRFVDDFLSRCEGKIVIYGLPEGALALYPEDVFKEMRERELGNMDRIGASFAARRSLRRFGSLSSPETISRQGRVSIPSHLQEFAGLLPGSRVSIVGVEIGVEIWAEERLKSEMSSIEDVEKEIRIMEIENSKENRFKTVE